MRKLAVKSALFITVIVSSHSVRAAIPVLQFCNHSGEPVELFEMRPSDDGLQASLFYDQTIDASDTCTQVVPKGPPVGQLYFYARSTDNSEHDWGGSTEYACAPPSGNLLATTWLYNAIDKKNIICSSPEQKIVSVTILDNQLDGSDYHWSINHYLGDTVVDMMLPITRIVATKHGASTHEIKVIKKVCQDWSHDQSCGTM